MKLAKSSMVTFGVGGVLLVGTMLGTAYMRQSQSADEVRKEIAQTRSSIDKLPAPPSNDSLLTQQKDLAAAIAGAQADYEASKSSLKVQLDTIESSNEIWLMARDSGVTLLGLSSPGVSKEATRGLTFSTLSVTVRAEGEVTNLVRFASMTVSKYPTATVKSAQITVPAPDPGGKETRIPSLRLTLVLSSYEATNG